MPSAWHILSTIVRVCHNTCELATYAQTLLQKNKRKGRSHMGHVSVLLTGPSSVLPSGLREARPSIISAVTSSRNLTSSFESLFQSGRSFLHCWGSAAMVPSKQPRPEFA